jgi:hypothetical protein
MRQIEPKELAELACEIEIDRLAEPVGKQDQFIAACGGLTCFTFHPDDRVDVEPLKISMDTKLWPLPPSARIHAPLVQVLARGNIIQDERIGNL